MQCSNIEAGETLLDAGHPCFLRNLDCSACFSPRRGRTCFPHIRNDIQGMPDDARPLYERALAIHEKALGPDDTAVAVSLSNLAGVLASQVRTGLLSWL